METEVRCTVCQRRIIVETVFAPTEHVSVMVVTKRVRHLLPMQPECVDALTTVAS